MHMEQAGDARFEAWLDEENRTISFHSIPGGRHYSTAEEEFWAVILGLVAAGYRIQ